MTIEKAIEHLVISTQFREDAKHDAKLRVFLGRHRKGEIRNGAAIELLLKYGYKISATMPKKKKA
jgi:hypothetical protein